ncbi:hypothetical protein [Methylorubrum populi]|nr:hypothetical protein [Methylorubrum populi]
MVKAMSGTESLLFVVGKLFGKEEAPAEELNSVSDMLAFGRMVNGE